MDNEINFISGGKPPAKKQDDDEVELIEWTHPAKSPFDELPDDPKQIKESPAPPRPAQKADADESGGKRPKLAEKHVQYKVADETSGAPAKEPLKHETSYARTPYAKLYESNGSSLPNSKTVKSPGLAPVGTKNPDAGFLAGIADFFKELFNGAAPEKKEAAIKPASPENKAVDMGLFADMGKQPLRKGRLQAGMQSTQGSLEGIDIIETNLIKDPTNMFINWQEHVLSLCLFVLIPALIVILFLLGFNFLEKEKQKEIASKQAVLEDLQSQITEYENKIQGKSMLDNLYKIRVAKVMLANHIYWTKFFKFLEENTLENTHYASFSGTIDGVYSLQAITEDLRSISEQFIHFRKDPSLKDVSVSGGQSAASQKKEDVQDPKVSYTLRFSIDPKIFIK